MNGRTKKKNKTDEFQFRLSEGDTIVVDMGQGIVTVENEDYPIEGKTFGSKLKSLRKTLFEIVGLEKMRQVINSLAATKKVAERVPAIAEPIYPWTSSLTASNPSIRVVAGSSSQNPLTIGNFLWLSSSAHVVEDDKKMMFGQVKDIRHFQDGSVLVTIEDEGRKGYVVDQSTIVYHSSKA